MNEVPTTRMKKPTTTLVNEVSAKQRVKTTNTANQQLMSKEVFIPIITKFEREKIVLLYKEETGSADLNDKSSLSKYNNKYNLY